MTVVFVSAGLSRGGAEIALVNLVSELVSDTDCVVVSVGKADASIHKNLSDRGVRTCVGICESLRFFYDIANGRLKIKIVQGWMFKGDIVAFLISKIFDLKLCFGCRHGYLSSLNDPLRTRLIYSVWIWLVEFYNVPVISVAEVGREAFKAYAGRAPKRWWVIPNGIRSDLSRELVERVKKARRAERIVFGWLGRAHPQKRLTDFVDSVWLINSDIRKEPPIFLVAGASLAEHSKYLSRDQTKFVSQASNVKVVNEIDPNFFFGSIDCLVSCSAFGEAFPNVVAEATWLGIPVIHCGAGDSASIAGTLGFFIEPYDVRGLADGIHYLNELSVLRSFCKDGSNYRDGLHWGWDEVARRYNVIWEGL